MFITNVPDFKRQMMLWYPARDGALMSDKANT
jgi:hypothetical protein